MIILAIESSGLVASTAVTKDNILLAEKTINNKKTHSQTLLPMIVDMLTILEMDIKDVDAIAISQGPGSFTGLRIGSATAKGLGLAADKPLINIPTLEAMAYNFYGSSNVVCPIMDARRNQVYTAVYDVHSGKPIPIIEQKACDINELAEELIKLNKQVIFTGDGIEPNIEILMDKLKAKAMFAPAHLNKQRAGAVAALGEIYFKENAVVSAKDHVPEYLRQSQAERLKQ